MSSKAEPCADERKAACHRLYTTPTPAPPSLACKCRPSLNDANVSKSQPLRPDRSTDACPAGASPRVPPSFDAHVDERRRPQWLRDTAPRLPRSAIPNGPNRDPTPRGTSNHHFVGSCGVISRASAASSPQSPGASSREKRRGTSITEPKPTADTSRRVPFPTKPNKARDFLASYFSHPTPLI
jgi:hypothetical protein